MEQEEDDADQGLLKMVNNVIVGIKLKLVKDDDQVVSEMRNKKQ